MSFPAMCVQKKEGESMKVKERFLHYISYDTQSDPKSGCHPSTEKQKILGKVLADELTAMGADQVSMDEYGYVYAAIPPSSGWETEPVIGWIAHMDTAPDYPGAGVKPQIVEAYDGGAIFLNDAVSMSPSDFPHLLTYLGDDLIVTDGTTLLGADDKAGIAEIMTAAELLLTDRNLNHGAIRIAFTPDEEIGEGANHFDVKGFGADFAYTVDGSALGEIEYECFHAAGAAVVIHGVNIHTGEAKDKMKNASLIAMEFVSMLPAAERPEHTQGYEGFYHLHSVQGNVERTEMEFLIRDHDKGKFQRRKSFMAEVAAFLNEKYGGGTVELIVKDSYYNMKEKIALRMEIVERAKQAMIAEGVVPNIKPIRGGTDGARLSYEGLPCPNLSAGGHNFHGRFEYIPVRSMETMVRVLLRLAVPGERGKDDRED